MLSRTLVVFFLYVNCYYALASPVLHGQKIKIKFDRTFYSLSYNTKEIVYKEGPNIFSMQIKNCNKVVTNKITQRYETLASDYAAQKNQSNNGFDVELLKSNGQKVQIPRGSNFGTWLRELPKNIMYYKAEAIALCKK